MQLSETITIAAPRDRVFAALTAPDILQRAIPGCESLTMDADGTMAAEVAVRIGPVKARFRGRVELDLTEAPEGMVLTGEGQGGPAGFAKGRADVTLTQSGDETTLLYTVDARIGGKLAQLGDRLVTGVARKLSARFFVNFAEILAETTQQPA